MKTKKNYTLFELIVGLLGENHIVVLPKEELMRLWGQMHPEKDNLKLGENPAGEENVSITRNGSTLTLMSMESYHKILKKANPDCKECP